MVNLYLIEGYDPEQIAERLMFLSEDSLKQPQVPIEETKIETTPLYFEEENADELAEFDWGKDEAEEEKVQRTPTPPLEIFQEDSKLESAQNSQIEEAKKMELFVDQIKLLQKDRTDTVISNLSSITNI